MQKINEIMVPGCDIEIYSTHKEGKSVAAERLFRLWNNKIHKYMTISKNVLN